MSARSRLRRLAVAAAAVTLLPALAAGATAPAADPPSTPVPIETPDGLLMSYVLNAKHANHGQMKKVLAAVEQAGGTVVQSWPQIGVVVAHADVAAFRDDVREHAGGALESVGATRSVAVSEGTPGEPGSATRHGEQKVEGEVGTEETTAVVADPLEGQQWDMTMIKADQAHEVSDGSRDVVVGVLDSGIDADHPDLAPNLDVEDSVNCSDAGRVDRSPTGWQPTTSDHGTHVAGTIAAARNGVGIVGVAPNVRMASVKVVNDDGFIYPEYAVCGFVWAGMHGMDVTNNSYYVDPFQFWCSDQPDQYAAKEAVRRAVEWSTRQGVVHAAAAGNAAYDLANKTTDAISPNDGTAVDRVINNDCEDIPTELDGVVTVSSMQRFPAGTTESRLSGFSNRGLGEIDVAAPGSSILSTIVSGNGYGFKSGTSMASPHVAGVLALMASAHPNWSPDRMVEALRAQADDKPCGTTTSGAPCVGTDAENSYFGDGVVDALDALS